MNTGDAIFCRGKGLLTSLVRHWTGSDFSHCGGLVMVGKKPHMLEANRDRGVCLTPLEEVGDYIIVSVDEGIGGRDVDNWVQSVRGAKYSDKDAILGGLDRPLECQGWQCAELLRTFLAKRHVKLPPDANTPTKILAALLHGRTRRIIGRFA